ncbi:MAG: oxygen-independent coproporphyrinogen III oxidase [Deltaproteobacteria bacterium]|nr:oxygen-independent coproporphyrinogen III oxidase [Deltaproteobacteria bacterium]
MLALSPEQREIYLKYAKLSVPRHTSYPAAPFWKDEYPAENVSKAVSELAQGKNALSLYVHIPYCRQLCSYCACNKEIYGDLRLQMDDPRDRLLDNLKEEVKTFYSPLRHNPVQQIHWGGGTPTFLNPKNLETLFETLHKHFDVKQNAEIAIEIDPRVTTDEHLKTLRRLGFNRISLGVQDFSEHVQKAVNRVQSYDLVRKSVETSRSLGFSSVNFDLIYGLPFQTIRSMEETLRLTLSLSPDRIAFYRLAMIPEMFKWQRLFKQKDLPSEETNLELFLLALNVFTDNGYEFVGFDHFAKKDEALTQALEEKTLRRNFQGYYTGGNLPIIGLGPSAVSQTDDHYWQTPKQTRPWEKHVKEGPKFRGMELDSDDQIRKLFLELLYCQGSIDWTSFGDMVGVDAHSYFASEKEALKAFEQDGLVDIHARGFSLTPLLGRLLSRLVGAQFDRHLRRSGSLIKFSQLG